jgi:hypothetical protein
MWAVLETHGKLLRQMPLPFHQGVLVGVNSAACLGPDSLNSAAAVTECGSKPWRQQQ